MSGALYIHRGCSALKKVNAQQQSRGRGNKGEAQSKGGTKGQIRQRGEEKGGTEKYKELFKLTYKRRVVWIKDLTDSLV